jgi:rhodanese-related sulfurtransferase
MRSSELDKNKTVLVICSSENRSSLATSILMQHCFRNKKGEGAGLHPFPPYLAALSSLTAMADGIPFHLSLHSRFSLYNQHVVPMQSGGTFIAIEQDECASRHRSAKGRCCCMFYTQADEQRHISSKTHHME